MQSRTIDMSVNQLKNDCRKHINPPMELVFVRKGKATVLCEGGEYILSEGQAMFIYPYFVHGFLYEENSHCDIFMFSKRIFGNFTDLYRIDPQECVFEVDSTTVGFIDMLLKSCDNETSQKAVFYAFANCCISICKAANNEVTTSDSMTDVVRYIASHFSEEIRLEDLGKRVGMTPRWLSKRFLETYGIKLVDFINNVRVNHANYLLETTEKSIGQISDECGFGSLRNFNRIFKANINCSPREQREKCMVSQTKNNTNNSTNKKEM